MPFAYIKPLVVPILCLIATLPAYAQPLFPHTESVESTVINADLVFIANLVKVGNTRRIQGNEVHNTVIDVLDTLKTDPFRGEPYQKLQVEFPNSRKDLEDWQKRSSKLLVTLKSGRPYESTSLELSPDKMEVMTADLKLLRKSDDVIKAAKKALDEMPPAVKRIHTFKLAVPRKTIAGTKWEKYYDTGGHLTVSVPVDKRLEKKAQDSIKSESYPKRIQAARAIRYFKSKANIARLKPLLEDPGFSTSYPGDPDEFKEERYYAARSEAYRTLKAWGVEVKKPVVREKILD